ncbi:MAG: hypothetical protein ACREQI_07965 [Candidatus Binataceae bacterium]
MPIALPRDKLRAARLESPSAVYGAQAGEKIGPDRTRRAHGSQSRDYPLALGDFDLLALLEKPFDLRKPVTQIAHIRVLHVMHHSVT